MCRLFSLRFSNIFLFFFPFSVFFLFFFFGIFIFFLVVVQSVRRTEPLSVFGCGVNGDLVVARVHTEDKH